MSQAAIGVMGGSYTNNPLAISGAPAGTIAAFYIPAAALPTVMVKTTTLRLNGQYAIDKRASVGMIYIHQHMTTVDWMYNGMQFGTGTNYLPTNEQAPNYTVNVVGVFHSYRFR